MAASGVKVHPDCVTVFHELKTLKQLKWIIYKISDDWTEIEIEETSTDPSYEVFREKLLNSKSKDRKGTEGIGGRYGVFDVEYELPNGEGKRTKVTFIAWVPDLADRYPKMMYSSSKEALKKALPGLAGDVQANDSEDLEWENIVSRVSKGR